MTVPAQYELTTTLADISTLKPHPANPRVGDIDAIAASLRANGQFKPIVVAADGTILAGNHTYMAALEVGWTRIAVVTVPVDPSSTEAVRIMLADNRTSDLARYDEGSLLSLLAGLDADGGLVGTGYTDDDLANLLKSLDTDLDFGEGGLVPLHRQPDRCPNCGFDLTHQEP